MMPILILFFRIHPQAAVGTDLLFATMTKSVGTLVHGSQRIVDWSIVRLLAMGSIPATLITLGILHGVGAPSDGVAHFMTHAIGVALLITAPSVLFRREIQRWAQNRGNQLEDRHVTLLIVMLGVALGALVTISSVGADIAHAVPLTLVAGLGHWSFGAVDLSLLAFLLAESIPGVMLGSLSIDVMPARFQQAILGVVLFAIGFKLVTT
ncbi:MAG: sulfite exporter TauE/SafE family protein [Acetobacteraceae bacterium]